VCSSDLVSDFSKLRQTTALTKQRQQSIERRFADRVKEIKGDIGEIKDGQRRIIDLLTNRINRRPR